MNTHQLWAVCPLGSVHPFLAEAVAHQGFAACEVLRPDRTSGALGCRRLSSPAHFPGHPRWIREELRDAPSMPSSESQPQPTGLLQLSSRLVTWAGLMTQPTPAPAGQPGRRAGSRFCSTLFVVLLTFIVMIALPSTPLGQGSPTPRL